MEDKKAEIEIIKFHIQLLKNVIKVIKLHQRGVEKLEPQEDFHRGSIAFGNVIIHQINQEINHINSH